SPMRPAGKCARFRDPCLRTAASRGSRPPAGTCASSRLWHRRLRTAAGAARALKAKADVELRVRNRVRSVQAAAAEPPRAQQLLLAGGPALRTEDLGYSEERIPSRSSSMGRLSIPNLCG